MWLSEDEITDDKTYIGYRGVYEGYIIDPSKVAKGPEKYWALCGHCRTKIFLANIGKHLDRHKSGGGEYQIFDCPVIEGSEDTGKEMKEEVGSGDEAKKVAVAGGEEGKGGRGGGG